MTKCLAAARTAVERYDSTGDWRLLHSINCIEDAFRRRWGYLAALSNRKDEGNDFYSMSGVPVHSRHGMNRYLIKSRTYAVMAG